MLQSYPIEIFYIVLVVGILLAIFAPYRAFLFVTFCLAARHFAASVQTRIFLGPYFNLNDALIFIGILALFLNRIIKRQIIYIPFQSIGLIIVLIAAVFIGYTAVGDFDENVIRYSKYAFVFPLQILIAASFVINRQRAKEFFFVLLLGATAASLHQTILYTQRFTEASTLDNIRDIGFLLHPGYGLILVFAFQQRFYIGRRYIWLAAVAPLFLVSILIDQTRSVWIGVFTAAVLQPFVFRFPLKRIIVISVLVIVIIVAALILFSGLFPNYPLSELVLSRIDLIQSDYFDTKNTRQVGGELEIEAWLNGNILIGRGLGSQADFAPDYMYSRDAAFGHLGYIAYLTYTGLIGFLFYTMYIPISVIRQSLFVYHNLSSSFEDDYVRALALIAVGNIIIYGIAAIFTSGYIHPNNAGIYYGAILGYHFANKKAHRDDYTQSLSSDHRGNTIVQSGKLSPSNHRIGTQSELS